MTTPSIDRTASPESDHMRIIVFGASGDVGSRVVKEAQRRGHQVTAVLRNTARSGGLPPGVEIVEGDASRADDVAALSRGHDIVVSAARPPAGRERELAAIARALLTGIARSGARLLLVGGAASLTVPGTGGRAVVDDPRYLPPEARPIALACLDQLEACRAETDADWTYLSPPALLQPGHRTGVYRLGGDELLVDAEGRSSISMEDFAVALLDEAERPGHRRRRFTVAY